MAECAIDGRLPVTTKQQTVLLHWMADVDRDRKRVDLVPAEAQRAQAEIEINNALGGRKGTAGDYGKNEAYLYERKGPEVLAFAKSPEDERGSRQCQGKN